MRHFGVPLRRSGTNGSGGRGPRPVCGIWAAFGRRSGGLRAGRGTGSQGPTGSAAFRRPLAGGVKWGPPAPHAAFRGRNLLTRRCEVGAEGLEPPTCWL
jgi:hypothetical protein